MYKDWRIEFWNTKKLEEQSCADCPIPRIGELYIPNEANEEFEVKMVMYDPKVKCVSVHLRRRCK